MMRYMLDTHYLLWVLADTKKLSKEIKDIVTDPENEIIISSISFWEVALKSALGKLKLTGFMPQELPSACTSMGFYVEMLSPLDSGSYHLLQATYHKDPFDRMLIWQAIRNGYTLISADENVKKYKSEGLKILR